MSGMRYICDVFSGFCRAGSAACAGIEKPLLPVADYLHLLHVTRVPSCFRSNQDRVQNQRGNEMVFHLSAQVSCKYT
jgi:hypothetical protein